MWLTLHNCHLNSILWDKCRFKTNLKALEIKFGGNLSYQSRHFISRCKSGSYVFRTSLTSSAFGSRATAKFEWAKFQKSLGSGKLGLFGQSEGRIFSVCQSQASIESPTPPAFAHSRFEEDFVSIKQMVSKQKSTKVVPLKTWGGKHIRSLNMLLIMSLKIFYGKFMSPRV
jgi:hypothetical protein